ncbi:MAG: hypothetical protein U0800_21600 [Isosphaeraceae bacterium]
MLTALVMRPAGPGETAYDGARQAAARRPDRPRRGPGGRVAADQEFMVDQIYRSGHEHYLVQLQEYGGPDRESPGQDRPAYGEDLPFRVVAPAFLISELTTSLAIGFGIYLPFLVIDLVVAVVLASMGLVMLPPSVARVAAGRIVFVLAGGWWLVAEMLLRSFGMQAGVST